MTNTAPMALMAAALFLAMQGGGTVEAGGAECPCGFTADVLPLWVWQGIVECKSEAGDKTTLVENPSKHPSPGFVAQLYIRGVCIQYDEDGVLAKKEPVASYDQVKACSQKIVEYAQELKDRRPITPGMVLLGNKCKLK